MVEILGDDGLALGVGRDEDGRNANAESVEREALTADGAVRCRRGRGNMVKAATTLIEHDEQGRRLPRRRVAHRVVDLGQEMLAGADIGRRVIVIEFAEQHAGLNPAERRQRALRAILEEIRASLRVFLPERPVLGSAQAQRRHRQLLRRIDVGGPRQALVLEQGEDARVFEVPAVVHDELIVEASAVGAAEEEVAIRRRAGRHLAEPAGEHRVLLGQGVEDRCRFGSEDPADALHLLGCRRSALLPAKDVVEVERRPRHGRLIALARRVERRLEVIAEQRVGLAITVRRRVVLAIDLDVDAAERLPRVGDWRVEVGRRRNVQRATGVLEFDLAVANALGRGKVREVTEQVVE